MRSLLHLQTHGIVPVPVEVHHTNQETTFISEEGNLSTNSRNTNSNNKALFLQSMSILCGTFLACIVTSLLTLIPGHDILKEPQYWYEFMIFGATGWAIMGTISVNLHFYYWADISHTQNWPSFIYLIGIAVLFFALVNSSLNLIWTYSLGLFPPVPFNYYITDLVVGLMLFVSVFFRIPKIVRTDSHFKKRFGFYFVAQCIRPIAAWLYAFLGTAFLKAPIEYQWIIGIFTPLVRELFVWTLLEVSYKASGISNHARLIQGNHGSHSKYPQKLKLSCIHYMGSRHALFLAVVMGSVATSATTNVIIALDFFINVYLGIKIIYLLKYSKKENSRIMAQEELQELVMNERVETIIPLTYILCFLLGYYGPNAEWLGNIQLTLWQFQGVTNVRTFLETLFLLVSIDFMSGIINGLILWKICKINIFKTLLDIQKEFWIVMAIQEGYLFCEIFGQVTVGSGHDLTLNFDWIHGKYVDNNASISLLANYSDYL